MPEPNIEDWELANTFASAHASDRETLGFLFAELRAEADARVEKARAEVYAKVLAIVSSSFCDDLDWYKALKHIQVRIQKAAERAAGRG